MRAAIGLTGQFSAVDDLLTGEEDLLQMAAQRHLGEPQSKTWVARSLEQFDLTEPPASRSPPTPGGMRRRLDLAMTLLSGPGA